MSDGNPTSGALGLPLERMGNEFAIAAPVNVYDCADGQVYAGVLLDTHWAVLCRLLERPDLDHTASFVAACMGEAETRSPFRVGGALTKTLLLGVICQRLREELTFDRETERFVGNARANALLDGPEPRAGWREFYRML